nr:MAG TPA: 4Fe-4S dicluster domain protein [Herelleviridae sp.]
MRKYDNSACIRCTECYNSHNRNLTVPFRQTSKQQKKNTRS